MKPTSFMSERTAEYALVYDLIRHIRVVSPRVIPMCFWSTQEGARTAEESMRSRRVRIIAAYARRPKVLYSDQPRILVKINAPLFTGAAEGLKFGIPVLTGVPLVTALSGFSIGVPCSWFHLTPNPSRHNDSEFLIPVSDQPLSALIFESSISGPLTDAQIGDLVKSETREMSWIEATEGMRTIRKAGYGYVQIPFAVGYRPFFIVILV